MSSLLLSLMILAAADTVGTPAAVSGVSERYIALADSADRYLKEEKWVDARRCTIEALREEPASFNNAMLLSNLGIINSNLGDYTEAIDNFTTALNIAPASRTIRANRARVYLTLSRYDEARADLQAIVDADPADDWARRMLAVTYLAAGDSKTAGTLLREITDPDADALLLLASIAEEEGNTDLAGTYYDSLVEKHPDEETLLYRALFLLTKCPFTFETSTRAGEDIERGLSLSPNDANLILLRAYRHRLLHENTAAESDKKIALQYGADSHLVERLFPSPPKRK